MCGRFIRERSAAEYARLFGVELPEVAPSYNVAPTQGVLALREVDGRREGLVMKWGMIPFWSKDGRGFINAKAETVAEKPAFRASFKKRRCLVAADGYYEWQTVAGKKQPWCFRLKGGGPFAFAGLWDAWDGPDGAVQSCAVLTTDANPLSRDVHDRMPVILTGPACDAWLDAGVEGALGELLRPYPLEEMEAYPCNPLVNNVRNNCPACLERA